MWTPKTPTQFKRAITENIWIAFYASLAMIFFFILTFICRFVLLKHIVTISAGDISANDVEFLPLSLPGFVASLTLFFLAWFVAFIFTYQNFFFCFRLKPPKDEPTAKIITEHRDELWLAALVGLIFIHWAILIQLQLFKNL